MEELLTLWKQSLTASQIAYRMGDNITRNAVIGKIHRLRQAGVIDSAVNLQRAKSAMPKHRPAQAIRKPVKRVKVVPVTYPCLLYTSPSPRDRTRSRMPSSA